jgi:hypothetical protein
MPKIVYVTIIIGQISHLIEGTDEIKKNNLNLFFSHSVGFIKTIPTLPYREASAFNLSKDELKTKRFFIETSGLLRMLQSCTVKSPV